MKFTYKHAPTAEDSHCREVYLEIRGEKGHSRWDSRYEILCGNLLDPPVIAKSVARWRERLDRWEQVKDIPTDERMKNPFRYGNACEDPQRCGALEEKGGNPRESICPKCPVYTECKVRGYLSQPLILRRAKAQISPVHRLFFDPRFAETLEQILDPMDETQRICILDERDVEIGHLFLDSWLSKDTLKQWSVNWHGRALGNFAKSLLSVLEIQDEPNGSAIGRVRSVVGAFQQHEEEIEVVHTKPTAWIPGNQVFQIRTGIYSLPRRTYRCFGSLVVCCVFSKLSADTGAPTVVPPSAFSRTDRVVLAS